MISFKVGDIKKIGAIVKGAASAFSLFGDGLEKRSNENLMSSWYNVGIYHKRAMGRLGSKEGLGRRYSDKELETI